MNRRRYHYRPAFTIGDALRVGLMVGTCLGCSVGVSWAGPEGGVVAGGSATIAQAGNSTTINQASERLLVDWNSFNVGSTESVRFNQPGSGSIAINRIHDANPSTILGSLSANGQIMLINPNGVVFGSGSQVDVGSLVVSTTSPTEQNAQDFVAGKIQQLDLSVAGNPNAQILNAGNITAKDAGLVGFVAPNVINNGVIIANQGTVQLASGDMATLDLYGDGLVDVAVSPDVQSQLIEQNGWVQADGGKVVISAAAGETIVNSVINMGGVTQARSIEQVDGKIILTGDTGTISVTGKIDASGRAQGQHGGTLTATAKHINLKTGSTVDASGDKGGGTVKIGGDYQGKGLLKTSDIVTMEQGATITNDAITSGDGGTTILWSDDHTYFAGSIFGRGGSISGDGGFVETSGKANLTSTGSIDLRAMHGNAGTWLIDPTNITIYKRSQAGTDNVNSFTTAYLESQNANINLMADNNITFNLANDTLALGNNYNLTLTATNGTIDAVSAGTVTTSGTGSITLIAGNNIYLANDLDLTALGSGNITLRANGYISYFGNGDITTNGGTITLNSDFDGNSSGHINIWADSSFVSNGGNITFGGGADATIGYARSDNANSGLSLADNGTGTLSPTINAGGGNIILNGQGWNNASTTTSRGVSLKGAQITTTGNGNITINGIGGGTAATTSNNMHGVFVYNNTDGGTPLIQAQNGTISITGSTYEASSTPSVAINIASGAIRTTGTGNINFTAKNIGSALGVMYGGGSQIINSGGNITYAGDTLSASGITMTATGDTIIRPYTAGTTVGIGSGTGTLQITDTALGKLTYGGTLWLGGYGLTGLETGYWNSSGNLTLNTTRNFAKNVNFISGADILSGAASTITLTGTASSTLWAINDINISHDLDITASGSGSVTERAGRHIIYSGSGDITTTGGAITLNSDRDAANGGAISLSAGTALTSNGGNITLGGGANPATTAAIGTDATYVRGVSLTTATIDARGPASTGGTIVINGTGWGASIASGAANAAHGVWIFSSSTVQTNNSGSVSITGVGGGTGAADTNIGIFLQTTGTVSAVNGTLTLNGTGGGGAGSNFGIGLSSSGVNTINSTGSGNILLAGTGGGGGNSNGFYFASTNGGIFSTSGSVTLTGTVGNGSSTGIFSATTTTIGGNTASGLISLISDKIDLGTALSIQTTGDVVIRPKTAATTVGIGSGTGFLSITDTVLNNINYGGTLWLGGYGLTGAETGYWNSSGNMTLNTTRSFAKNVNFISGSNIINAGTNLNGTGTANILLKAANQITTTSTGGLTTATGNIELTATNGIALSHAFALTSTGGNINLNNNITSTVAQTFNAGGTLTANAITMGANDLTLTADDLILNGNLSGTGTLTLQPYATNRVVNLNYGSADGTNFNISTAEIARLTDGWNTINIGQIGGATNMWIGQSNWTDNVNLRSNHTKVLAGLLTLTNGASLTVTGNIDTSAAITTDGGSVTVSAILFGGTGAAITTSGGAVTINTLSTWNGGAGQTINTSGGNITINGQVRMEGTPTGSRSFVLNAGSGTVSFGNTVNTNADMTVTSSAMTFNGAWGGTSALGNVTLTSTGSISLPTITTLAGKTVSATVTGAGNSITASTIATGAGGNISLTADDLILGGNLSGTGTLTLQPYTASRFMYLNRGTADGTNFHLSSTDLSRLVNGWSLINIGRTDSSGNMELNATTWTDNLNLRNTSPKGLFGDMTITDGASLTITGNMDVGAAIITNGGSVTSTAVLFGGGGSISTNGGAVTLNNLSTWNNGPGVSINTSGGNIAVSGFVDMRGTPIGTRSFALNAGAGTVAFGNTVNTNADMTVIGNTITFNGAWGVTTALGNVTLTSAGSISLPAITTLAGKTVNATVTGAGNTITASTIATGAAGNITLTADDLILGGNLSGTGTLTLQPYATNRGINVNYGTDDGSKFHLNTTEISRFVNGWSLINIGRTNGTGYITINNSNWTDPLNIRSSSNKSLFAVAMTDGATLTVTGDADIRGAITTNGGSFTATGAILGYGGSISTNGGHVTTTTLTTWDASNGLSINTSGGNLSINGSTTIGGTPSGSRSFVLNAGSGTVSFGNTVNTDADITITGGNITFNGAWGGTSTLGNVTLTSTSGISLPSITTAAGKTVSATVTGAGNSIMASTIATGTNGNITLTADNMALNGNLSGTGTLTLQANSTNRTVNINKNTDNGTSLHLVDTELNKLVNGWSLINIGRSDSTGTGFIGYGSFSDNVVFREGNGYYVDGLVNGTDNNSFTFLKTVRIRNGSVATAANNINFSDSLATEGSATITTNGGNVSISNGTLIRDTGAGDLNISTNGGNITLNAIIDQISGSGTAGKNIILSAGIGTIAFNSTINTSTNLTATANTITFNTAWGGVVPPGAVSLTSVNSLSLPSITASSVFARTTGGTADITIGSGKAITGSGANGITLVAARNFINQAGSGALIAGGSGRWLVYSTNVTGTTGEQDLTSNFNRYSCSYAGGCATGVTVPTSGNGLLYSFTPTLTVTPTTIGVTYGEAVTGLNGYGYSIAGYLGSDGSSDSVSGSLVGVTPYTAGNDVATYALNYNSGSLASAMGYGFTYANKSNGINVTARVLTASLTETVTKIYDGTSNAALAVGNYILSNVYNSDDVALGNITSGTYNDKNVGSGKTVSVNGLFLNGAKAGNYTLASGSISGNVGVVTPKGLTVTANSGLNKTYGQSDSALTYTYNGLASGDVSASFSGVLDRAVGENAGSYAINVGNLAATGNYAISSFVANNYMIHKAGITITAPMGSRYYGDDNATYTWADATITGLQNGETGAVLDSLVFTVAGSATSTANAGSTHAITLGGFNDTNYTLSSFTGGMLTIAKAPLTISADSKIRVSVTPQPTLTASFSGLRNNEPGSVVSGLTLSTADHTGAPVGSYSITASGGTAVNYSITYVNGTMTVTAGALPTTIANPTIIVQTGNGNSVGVPVLNNSVTGTSGNNPTAALNNPDNRLPLILWDNTPVPLSLTNVPLVTFSPELKELLGMDI